MTIAGTKFQRFLQRGRAETIVDRQPGAGLFGDGGNRCDIDELGQRIGWRLDENEFRCRAHSCFVFDKLSRGDKRRLHAELAHVGIEESLRRTEQATRSDDVIARFQQAHAGGKNRSHAGRRRHAGLAAFERGQPHLQHVHRLDW